MSRITLALLALTLWPAVALATVEGRVRTQAGVAVEQARVEDANGGRQSYTDGRGAFRLDGVVAPLLLVVSHPRFEDAVVELAELPGAPLEIILVPKQTVFEEIVVSATRDGEALPPVSIASTVLHPAEDGAPPSSLSEAVVDVAGVAENGQGGLFQVISIRGVSRGRVLPLIAGMRVITERRAGASVSFLDPLLMGSVDVLRGPASTWYGSGALGGVMQVFPRRFEGWTVATGYETQGDERHLAAGWGDGHWSLGLATRRAEGAEAGDGSPLFSGFTQHSATVSRIWEAGGRDYELLVVPAAGRDIEKPNVDVPERTTVYPEDDHLLVRFAVSSENGWQLSAWAHPNELETVAVEEGVSRNVVENRAVDFGLYGQWRTGLGSQVESRYGFEVFGRRGVEAVEREIALAPSPPPSLPAPVATTVTLDGSEDEAAAYGSLRFRLGAVFLETGGRLTWLRQENAGAASRDQTAWSGFAGLTLPLGSGYELAANLGSGLRFPSLTERFFTGTTGRGQVIGNPDLDPERSLSVDAGVRWYGKRLFVSAFVFRTEITDYIERVRIGPDLRTFVNLTSGTIDGVEVEGFYEAGERWRLSWGGHLMNGEDDAGGPLADVPPAEVRLGARHSRGPWRADARLALREGKDDPGSGEVAIPGATLFSASLSRELIPGLWLALSGSNLLDDEYFPSADDKASLAPGRSLALGVRWSSP